MRRPTWLLNACFVVACTFDSSAPGQDGFSESGEAASSLLPTAGPTGDPDATASSEPTGSSTTASSDSTDATDTGDGAELELSPGYDFGAIDVDTMQTHRFVLENFGNDAATNVITEIGDAGFSITDTDCGNELRVGEACSLEVTFAPETLGPFDGKLVIGYTGGDTSRKIERAIEGGGAGSSQNLIANGGGESCTNGRPDHWTQSAMGEWGCVSDWNHLEPAQGGLFLFAGPAPTGMVTRLSQTVVLAPHIGELVAAGDLGVRFAGQHSSSEQGDDPHQLRVEFLDAEATIVEVWESGWFEQAGWATAELTGVPHPQTKSARVHLECETVVPSYCSALFDDISLGLSHPPPS